MHDLISPSIGHSKNNRLRKVVKVLPQHGGRPRSIRVDRSRRALSPGKRISKNGNIYWETRMNRSDSRNRRI